MTDKFTQIKYSKSRRLATDILREGKKKHHAFGFYGVDISIPRSYIDVFYKNNNERLSFTAYLIKCVAKAVSEYPYMQGLINGFIRKRIRNYTDVDVAIFIERQVAEGEYLPTIYIVRDAQNKTFQEISKEIRSAQNKGGNDIMLEGKAKAKQAKLLSILPKFIRKIVWSILLHKPNLFRSNFGTVVISSVGMHNTHFSQYKGTTIWPFALIVGGIGNQPIVIKDQENKRVEVREVLGITTAVDHVVVDGAPAARFFEALIQTIRTGENVLIN